MATTLPFVIWKKLSIIDEVPYTLEHAARQMGASRLNTLRRVELPLVASGLVVTFQFIIILNWSEFLLALPLTQPQVSTLPVLLNKFQSAVEGRLYGPQAAIGTVIALPVVILGILVQKHLITGFSFGMKRKKRPSRLGSPSKTPEENCQPPQRACRPRPPPGGAAKTEALIGWVARLVTLRRLLRPECRFVIVTVVMVVITVVISPAFQRRFDRAELRIKPSTPRRGFAASRSCRASPPSDQ
ncbi:hypothetical protein NKDENANG_00599 [Candidatus Entotheonellaceae bacterium PAL068K]